MTRKRKRWRRRIVGGVVGLTLGYLAAGYAYSTAARHQQPAGPAEPPAPVVPENLPTEHETPGDQMDEHAASDPASGLQ